MKPAPKRYDIFTFFNELDLLEIRLNILNDQVDYFVIVECAETFSGQPKPLIFAEHRDRFKQFAGKIIYYEVKNVPRDEAALRNRLQDQRLDPLEQEIIHHALTSDNITKGVVHWLKEFYQKESIKKALVNLADDDICFIGDVDEIWNPAVMIDFTKDDIYKLRQKMYAYYLNNRSSEVWAGTLVTTYKNIKNSCLNHLRTPSKTPYTYIDHGGWHFTNQGGADKVITKLEAEYSHDDYNTPEIKTLVKTRMKKNQDYIGRKFKFWIDETDLPSYIIDHKILYQNLFKNLDVDNAIIVKLQGGLGNQLFQYAIGRALALRHNTPLLLDITGYNRIKPTEVQRQYSLNHFNIVANLATPKMIYRLRVDDRPGLLPALRRRLHPTKPTHAIEQAYTYDKTVTTHIPPLYLDGYWQSPKYFQLVEAQIRQDFSLKPDFPLSTKLVTAVQQSQSVSVHIRRGDYVTNAVTKKHQGSLPLAYYQRAAACIQQQIPQPHWFVFSDDITWVKNNLPLPGTTTFVSDGVLKDYEELVLMSYCQNHIIANSSFSWWGAWLNHRTEKIVIAPKKWFNDTAFQTTDLLPNNWIQL